MKKAALVMMLCMSMSLPVFAQEAAPETTQEVVQEAVTEAEAAAAPAEYVWDDTMQELFVEAGYSGTFYTVDALGMEMLVPDGLEKRQPTEEESATDTVLVFENEAGDQKIELVLGPVAECQTLDEVKAFMAETYPGLSVNETIINGLDTLVFGSEETDSMTVLIGAGDAGFLRVICRPVTDKEMNSLYAFVAASIKPIAEEAE